MKETVEGPRTAQWCKNKGDVHSGLDNGNVLAHVRTSHGQLGLVRPHQRDLGVDETAEDADVQPNEVDP